MGAGADYAKRTSKFIKIEDGEFVEGIYNGCKFIIKDSFGEEKEVARYKIDDKVFDSMSGGLATQMDEIKTGHRIRITRKGKSMDTKYTVTNLSAPEPVDPEKHPDLARGVSPEEPDGC